MLFNSLAFLFIFLPTTFTGYFLLSRFAPAKVAIAWLVIASLFFYSFWNPQYLPLILGSLLTNYFIGWLLTRLGDRHKWLYLTIGITFNLLLLGYYKYTDFLISNLNAFTTDSISLKGILLPLGISFFTFQQIAYLVDSYRGLTKEQSLLNYALFVTFFPQLIAGPIVHHSEMMNQFKDRQNNVINFHNIAVGLFILSIGLFKKVGIADMFAVWANAGFNSESSLTFLEAWATALSYTFQIYFDFSGYTDMAIGIALLFNIKLPINFNSPYKATDIQDFWRRWHITLTRFLRDYVYIPLGGSRKSVTHTRLNFLIVFLVGGLWHGPAWTFVLWGALHGVAMITHHLWKAYGGIRLHYLLGWSMTFTFIVFTWVVFRAENIDTALMLWKGMLGFNGISISPFLAGVVPSFGGLLQFDGFYQHLWQSFTLSAPKMLVVFLMVLGVVTLAKNTHEIVAKFRPNVLYFSATVVLFCCGLYFMNTVSEFIYFNF